MRKFLSLLLLLASVAAVAAPTEYNVVIGYPPGGETDTSLRQFQSVVESGGEIKLNIDYKVGAGGMVAMKYFLSSNDTRLLLWTGSGLSVANEILKKNPEFTSKDFRPVVMTESTPFGIIRSPKSNKINSLDELYAPGCDKRVIISASSPTHEIIGKIIEKTSTCKVSMIMYQGDAAALADNLNGSIDVVIGTWTVGKTILDQGGTVLATTASPKDPEWKQYPTLSRKVPGAVVYTNFGLLANKNMTNTQLENIIVPIKATWGNPAARKKYTKAAFGIAQRELYGKDFQHAITTDIDNLKKLAQQLNFQK